MEKKDIASLVERAKNKDKSALGELYNATHKQAYFVAIKMTNNEDDAMDILQDSYVKAFTKLDKLENPEQFQSWFNQIVANGCRDFFKKKKAIYFSETEDEDGGTIADTFEDDDESIMPDKSLDNEETKRLVMKIIEGLSEEQKLCVLMYYYENMSVADIAESLECSTGTVKSRLNYARQKIKSEVENLEKTQGIKLYSIAPIPFVIWVLTRTAEATVVPESVTAAVLGTATTAAGATAAGAAGTAGAATTAGTTAGTAETTAATAATGKIIAAVTAGVLVVGGGTAAAITVANANSEPTAVVEEVNLSDFEYEYDPRIDGMVITKYVGDDTEVTIPSEIDGVSVKCIGADAFFGCENLSKITILNSVEYIDNRAFECCISITEITIPDSVISIGPEAFACCYNIHEVKLSKNLKYIGHAAFSGCEKICEIALPQGIEEIDDCAFIDCGFTKITIPDSLTHFGNDVFLGNYDIKIIYKGEEYAYSEMYKMKEIINGY